MYQPYAFTGWGRPQELGRLPEQQPAWVRLCLPLQLLPTDLTFNVGVWPQWAVRLSAVKAPPFGYS
jgi:hypothetical protein